MEADLGQLSLKTAAILAQGGGPKDANGWPLLVEAVDLAFTGAALRCAALCMLCCTVLCFAVPPCVLHCTALCYAVAPGSAAVAAAAPVPAAAAVAALPACPPGCAFA